MTKKYQDTIVDNYIIKINSEKNATIKNYADNLDNVIAFPKVKLEYKIVIGVYGCYDDDDLPNIVIEDIV